MEWLRIPMTINVDKTVNNSVPVPWYVPLDSNSTESARFRRGDFLRARQTDVLRVVEHRRLNSGCFGPQNRHVLPTLVVAEMAHGHCDLGGQEFAEILAFFCPCGCHNSSLAARNDFDHPATVAAQLRCRFPSCRERTIPQRSNHVCCGPLRRLLSTFICRGKQKSQSYHLGEGRMLGRTRRHRCTSSLRPEFDGTTVPHLKWGQFHRPRECLRRYRSPVHLHRRSLHELRPVKTLVLDSAVFPNVIDLRQITLSTLEDDAAVRVWNKAVGRRESCCLESFGQLDG